MSFKLRQRNKQTLTPPPQCPAPVSNRVYLQKCGAKSYTFHKYLLDIVVTKLMPPNVLHSHERSNVATIRRQGNEVKELTHVLTVQKLTESLRPASNKPPGFTMLEAQRIILHHAGFTFNSSHNTGVECPVCLQRVKVTPYGYVTTHQNGQDQCPFSNTNHFKRTLSKMRRDRWVRNANLPKKKTKKRSGPPHSKKKRKGMTRQDRLIYATGHITIAGGGLPTLGKNR